MRIDRLEAWILDVVTRVENGQRVEDDRVELKAEWPPHGKAARRIAGHANASRGPHVLWVIGVDEKRGVCGVHEGDTAEWIQRVQAQFVEVAPSVQELAVPVGELSVVGLLFETGRRPFVVKNPVFGKPDGGAVENEVPWRDGTRVRSARHSDLVRVLVPRTDLPEIDILEGVAGYFESGGAHAFDVKLTAYIVPQVGNRTTIPFYRCEASIEVDVGRRRQRFRLDQIRLVKHSEPATGADTYQLDLPGPRLVQILARTDATSTSLLPNEPCEIEITIRPNLEDVAMTTVVRLAASQYRDPSKHQGLWDVLET